MKKPDICHVIFCGGHKAIQMVASGYSSQWKALDYAKIWKGELQKKHWDMFEMHNQPFTRNKPPKKNVLLLFWLTIDNSDDNSSANAGYVTLTF